MLTRQQIKYEIHERSKSIIQIVYDMKTQDKRVIFGQVRNHYPLHNHNYIIPCAKFITLGQFSIGHVFASDKIRKVKINK
jgi:hypothetical protein